MKTSLKLAALTLCLSTINSQLSTLHAQDTAFTYQGRLNDGANLANGRYDLRFALFDAVSAGAQQGNWQTNAATAVSNGLFTVTLDFGNQFAGANRWLEIAVRPSGAVGNDYVTLSPRQQITAAPYAIRATSAYSATTAESVLGPVPASQITGTVASADSARTVLGLNVNTNLASVALGKGNIASGVYAAVGGGYGNTASGVYATVSGGFNNVASGANASVGGGDWNTATGDRATMAGGFGNGAGGYTAALGGGLGNLVGGDYATVSGGANNSASGGNASVGGGHLNQATNLAATVPGGENNLAGGQYSFAAGQRAKALHAGTFLWADHQTADFASTTDDQFLIRAAGGVGINNNNPNGAALAVNGNVTINGSLGTPGNQPLEFKVNGDRALRLEPNATSPNLIGGSPFNVVSNGFVGAVIAGGGDAINRNRVGANFATVVGGGNNTASGPYATAMGGGSVASGQGATAMGASAQALGPNSTAMGYTSVASGDAATAMGDATKATGYSSTAMGSGSTASGEFSTAMGDFSIASGDYSLAAGYLAHAAHPGAFVWGDASVASPFASTANNQFLIRAAGGVGINKNNPATALDVAGTVTATAFSGNGAGLTNLPTSAVAPPPPGMVLIPAGAFTMGDTLDGLSNATPVSVSVSAFYMDVNEVTLSKWHSVHYWAADHGYSFLLASGKAANHPVHTVSWYDCVKWCNARSEQAGRTPVYYTDAGLTAVYRAGDVTVYANWTANGFRLPTEAEWEKAARGGQSGQRFPWSNWFNQNLANYNGNTASYAYDLGPNGFNAIGSNGGTFPATSPVGSFAANGYGLNDMAGNVMEFCWDWYGTPYTGGIDPHGPVGPLAYRVLRGGAWSGYAGLARCASRSSNFPSFVSSGYGFRCVRGL